MNPNHAWTTRLVDAPAVELLSKSDLARLLGVSQDTIDRLVEDGDLPEPLRIRKQAAVWDWRDVAYYRLRMLLAARLRTPPPASGGKPTAPEG